MAGSKRKTRFVEPSDPPPALTEAEALFVGRGWSEDDARWLAPLAVKYMPPFPERQGEVLHPFARDDLHMVASAREQGESRDEQLYVAFARLAWLGGDQAMPGRFVFDGMQPVEEQVPPTQAQRAELAGEFRSHGTDFELALSRIGWPGTVLNFPIGSQVHTYMTHEPRPGDPEPSWVKLMLCLYHGAQLDLSRVIDAGAVIEAGKRRMSDPRTDRTPRLPDRSDSIPDSPRSLVLWMLVIGPNVLESLLPAFREMPTEDERFVPLALGIKDAIERCVCVAHHHWTYLEQAGPALGEALCPFMGCIRDRVKKTPDSQPLRELWMWFVSCTYQSNSGLWVAEPPEAQRLVLSAATEDLARLRKLFARASSAGPPLASQASPPEGPILVWEEYEWHREHLDTCLTVLAKFGGLWSALKPLLMAIRALRTPCVSADLRYWLERDGPHGPRQPHNDPPRPWSELPLRFVNLVHFCAGKEQEMDPTLESLRGELARFCLDRLRDRWTAEERRKAKESGRARTDDDMIERSAVWRYCLVRAFSVLGINPAGTGHRVLHMAATTDPDKEVREAARQAYEQVRRGVGLDPGRSPRTAILFAFWWIRQGHLLDLEVEIDSDGAQRTRAKELSRTKEAER